MSMLQSMVQVSCLKCGYKWEYKGKHKHHTKCPRCHVKVWFKPKPEKIVEGVKLKCNKCDYEWIYTGKGVYAQCPSCLSYIKLPNTQVLKNTTQTVRIRSPFITEVERKFGVRIREKIAQLIEKYYKEQRMGLGYSRFEVYMALAYVILRDELGVTLREFMRFVKRFGYLINSSRIINILKKLGIKTKQIDVTVLVDRYAKYIIESKEIIEKAKEIAIKLNELGGKNPTAVALASIYIASKYFGKDIEMRDLVKFGVTDVTIRSYFRKWLELTKYE